MALIKLTAIVDNISGKLNGTVFAKNKGGHYMRSKSKPANPKTSFQTAVRARFGAIAQLWGALTQAQRNAWNAMASEFPYTNRLGDTKILSGFALHQKLNTNLAIIGQSFVSNPPSPTSPNGVVRIDLGANVAEEEFTLTGEFAQNVVTTPSTVVIMATPPLRDGVSNFDNQLREIGTASETEVRNGLDILDMYQARFGAMERYQKIGVSVYTIANGSGISSVAVSNTVIAE